MYMRPVTNVYTTGHKRLYDQSQTLSRPVMKTFTSSREKP